MGLVAFECNVHSRKKGLKKGSEGLTQSQKFDGGIEVGKQYNYNGLSDNFPWWFVESPLRHHNSINGLGDGKRSLLTHCFLDCGYTVWLLLPRRRFAIG